MKNLLRAGLCLLAFVLASTAPGQGLPTATLTGRVVSDGQPIPGVSVTATSPTLQRGRSAVTSANGDYVFANVPPGEYTVTFELTGFQKVTKAVTLAASQQTSLDAAISLAGVAAEAGVVGRAETISASPTASTTYTAELTSKLPTTRTLLAAALLSPGVNENAPRSTSTNGFRSPAITISGAQSFENLFTVDGVVIQDNLRATPNNLFIEDAIQETTTTTAAVSAEFGRFSGGVVNTLTKSGGNNFSGSFRTSFTNDAWTAISPRNEARVQDVVPSYEPTFGGPIWKDKIWFFGAARLRNEKGSGQTSFTNISYETGVDTKRYVGKITLAPVPNHTLTTTYTKVDAQETNGSFGTILDLDSLKSRSLPEELLAINYNGVLSNSLFAEAQYSRRKFTFENDGSQYTDLIKGTLLRDRSRGNARYNSPTFCGVCSPEKRDNEDILVKGTYFLSTPSFGSHNIVLGYDNFSGQRKANNYQSGSNYRIFTTAAILRDGDIFPVIDGNTYFLYQPIETLSQGSDVRTHSAFLNDVWRLNDHLSFNVGIRYDRNAAKDSRQITTANDDAFSPRLSASYDVTGTGKLTVRASYARYVAAIQESQVDSTSNAGSASTFYWYYEGPPINTNASGPLLTRAQALNQFFQWFFGTGGPDHSTVPYAGPPSLPGFTVQLRGTLVSPSADEFVLGLGGSIGSRGSFRIDGIYRNFNDFYSNRLDRSTGKVTDPTGQTFDLTLVENSNLLDRKYTALQTQFAYRVGGGLNVGGNWTWSHTLGNFDGETAASGPVPGTLAIYPEYKQQRWNTPSGDLATDQRHRVRVYATADLPVPAVLGNLSVSAIQSFDTGTPYGALGAVASRRYVADLGYQTPPASVGYYYTARDAFRTDTVHRTDVALNYSRRIGPIEFFVQPQVINLFNNQAVIGVDTTVQDATSAARFLPFNPFTDTPIQGARPASGTGTTNWNFGPNFGKPRNVNDYQQPRTFRASVGIRF